jgi:hypothetical protein
MSFRWQKGRFSTSLSRRGGRAGYRLGCALPILAALAVAAVSCGGVVTPTEGDTTFNCTLPWDSMDQVEGCATDDARIANMSGIQIDVLIRSKDPEQIARALAGTWVAHEDMADEIVVWGFSKAAVQDFGVGYDRGVVSEQGELGEKLVFEICTSWESAPGPGDLCSDKTEFTVEQ